MALWREPSLAEIEIGARAICKARFLNGGNDTDDGWDDAPDGLKAEYRAQAKAVIIAIRVEFL